MIASQTLDGRVRSSPEILDLAEFTTIKDPTQKAVQRVSDLRPLPVRTASSDIDDFDRTSKLIEGASRAIGALASRCELFEAELEQEKARCSEQSMQIELLEKALLECQAKADAYENDINLIAIRCQAAETRVAEFQQSQDSISRRAIRAESIANKLRQQVEAAFGQGSPIRSFMDDIQFKQAAE